MNEEQKEILVEWLEELEDLRELETLRKEPRVPLEVVLKELQESGNLK